MPLAWAQWLAALLDAVEDIALLFMLRRGASRPWPRVARWCGVIEVSLKSAGAARAAVGVLARLPRRRGAPEAGRNDEGDTFTYDGIV